jgi:hypothetical protein
VATIGLRINDPNNANSPDTSLANTFAKALFGDPDEQAKIALAKAHIAAQGAYGAKLGADTGLVQEKTREQKMRDDAAAAAAGAVGDAYAAAVPMPVPVENTALRPSPGFAGPMPGIVQPQDQALYDAEVAAAHKMGPLIVTTPGNPAQVAQGFSRGLGTFGVVNQTNPDKARTFGGLAVDTQPSVSTVQTSGDTAGQDAVAKKDIQVETAKANLPQVKDVPGVGLVSVQGTQATPIAGAQAPTFGATDKGLLATVYTTLKAKLDSGQSLTGLEKAQYETAAAAVAKENAQAPITGKPDEVLYTRDPANPNKLIPMEGQAKPDSKVVLDEKGSRALLADLSTKVRGGYKPTLQEATTYSEAFSNIHGAKPYTFRDPATNTEMTTTIQEKVPPGVFEPMEIFQAGGHVPVQAGGPAPLQPGGPMPAGSASASPVPSSLNPATDTVKTVYKGRVPPATAEMMQFRTYAPLLLTATEKLDKLPSVGIPDAFIADLVTNRDAAPTIMRRMAEAYFPSPEAKAYGQAVAEFSAQLYAMSGKAITPGEFESLLRGYVPRPGDETAPQVLMDKQLARHTFLASSAENGWSNDPDTLQEFLANAKARGVDLTGLAKGAKPGQAPPVSTPAQDASPPGAPPGARKAPDGKWYVPDPARPGKYLQVQ